MLIWFLWWKIDRTQIEILNLDFSYFSFILVIEVFHWRLWSKEILKRALDLNDIVQSGWIDSSSIWLWERGVPMRLWFFWNYLLSEGWWLSFYIFLHLIQLVFELKTKFGNLFQLSGRVDFALVMILFLLLISSVICNVMVFLFKFKWFAILELIDKLERIEQLIFTIRIVQHLL